MAAAVILVSILPAAALTPSGPTTAAPANVQPARISAQKPHLITPFLPRVAPITPQGISGFTTYTDSGPQLSVTFWKGTGIGAGYTDVVAGIDKTGRPFINDNYGNRVPQITNVQRGTGTAVVFGTRNKVPFQKSAQVPFLTGNSAYGPFVVTFLLTDNGKWVEPRFTLQNKEGCTNGSPLKVVHGTVSYGNNPYLDLANYAPFGPQVYLASRGDVVTGLGFSVNAPYSPYGDVQKVGRDYITSLGSVHLGFVRKHGVGDPYGVSCAV